VGARAPTNRASGKAVIAPVRVSAAGPGTVTLAIRPTPAGRARLRRRRPLGVPIQVTFVPAGGVASSQTTTIQLGARAPAHPPVATTAARPIPSQYFSFDGSTDDWEAPWGDITLAASARHHFSGPDSLQLTIHRASFSAVDSPFADADSFATFTDSLQPGDAVDMWIYRPASTPSTVGIRPMVRVGGNWTYCPSAEVFPPSDTWTELQVSVPSLTGGCGATPPERYHTPNVETVGLQVDDPGGRGAGKALYLDSVSW
jgi:hypothetical protein